MKTEISHITSILIPRIELTGADFLGLLRDCYSLSHIPSRNAYSIANFITHTTEDLTRHKGYLLFHRKWMKLRRVLLETSSMARTYFPFNRLQSLLYSVKKPGKDYREGKKRVENYK
jgi:hypothetical protein